MAAFCLNKQFVDKFLSGLRSGEIDPAKLADMASADRHAFLENYVGKDNAKEVNALFESKLLLKDQQQGYIRWAKKVAGITPEVRRDLISRIEKMDKVLNPQEEQKFLNDLASKKLGIDVTLEEAKKIADLGKAIEDKKQNVTDQKSRIDYGNAILDLYDYTDSLTKTKMGLIGNLVNIANVPRSIMSSLDFSAPFRQGFGMISHPKEFASAFGSMFKYAFSKTAYRNLMADIITRDNYDLMKSSKLRITSLNDKLSQREEAFISSLTDKIPGISASERAYTGFLNKLRADVFDKAIKVAEAHGENVSKGSQAVQDIASVINNFTGSGNFGKNDRFAGAVPLANSIFFSPRKIAATINVFNPVEYARLSPTARGLAIRNLVGMVGFSALMMTLGALVGGKVETDTNSSDFGKVQFGKTRIDVTGGNANYIVLLSRLITGKTKSSLTDVTKDLGSGYASATRADILTRYMRNKLSPTASFIADFLYGKDSQGNTFNLTDEARNRIVPLVISDIINTAMTDPSHALLAATFDTFGFGVQTYSNDVNWNQSTTKELQQFKDRVGPDKFNEANNKYNALYNSWSEKTMQSDRYKNLSDTAKQTLMTKGKDVLRTRVLKGYGFIYKQKTTPQQKSESRAIKGLTP